MIDNDIIKALECCHINKNCKGCPQKGKNDCLRTASIEAIGLINRQNAEIERLNDLLDDCKADTIQEFIKRFEKKIKDVKFTIGQTWEIKSAIKEVVKGMVGEG